MKYPGKLKKNGTVGLICTSSHIRAERTAQCIKAVENLGYRVKAADNMDSLYMGYMAGDGMSRGMWVNRMFADPEVDAIFCIGGGYGSDCIMEYLDYDLIRNNPKILIGFSDVTHLLLGVTQNCGFTAFYGPMVSTNIADGFDEASKSAMYSAVNGDGIYVYSNPDGYDIRVLHEGKARGELTGGTLSLLCSSLGTPYEVDTRDKILFIEDVGETVKKIYRMAMQLKNSGKLSSCRAVLLGQFTSCENNTELKDIDAVSCFADILRGFDIPVMINLQTGHGKSNITLPIGAMCSMDTRTGRIIFEIER